MSQPDLASSNVPRGVVVQKPKSNIYTALLAVSAAALALGCLLLYIELYRHAPANTNVVNFMAVFGSVKPS